MSDIEQRRRMMREEFDKWHEERKRDLKMRTRTDENLFVNAWGMAAYYAEAQRDLMGRELNKLQQRVGRQRRANREQLRVLREKSRWLSATAASYFAAKMARDAACERIEGLEEEIRMLRSENQRLRENWNVVLKTASRASAEVARLQTILVSMSPEREER